MIFLILLLFHPHGGVYMNNKARMMIIIQEINKQDLLLLSCMLSKFVEGNVELFLMEISASDFMEILKKHLMDFDHDGVIEELLKIDTFVTPEELDNVFILGKQVEMLLKSLYVDEATDTVKCMFNGRVLS